MSQTTSTLREATRAGDMPAVIDTVRSLDRVESVSISRPTGPDAATLLVVPKGKEVVGIKAHLDAYLKQPERRKGTATLTDLASFIEHANRFKDADSAIFAHRDEAKPSLTAVLDYHRSGATADPRFGTHRGHYAFPVSEQWDAWAKIEDRALSQAEFAAWLEERIMDVIQPPADIADLGALAQNLLQLIGDSTRIAGPTKLLEISRGLRMKEMTQVTNAQVLSTGEVEMVFRVEQQDEAGQPLRVPSLFLLGIPVFEGGAAYRLPVRLSYRRSQGSLVWYIKRYRPEIVFFDAFDEGVADVKEKTALPVFMGAPET